MFSSHVPICSRHAVQRWGTITHTRSCSLLIHVHVCVHNHFVFQLSLCHFFLIHTCRSLIPSFGAHFSHANEGVSFSVLSLHSHLHSSLHPDQIHVSFSVYVVSSLKKIWWPSFTCFSRSPLTQFRLLRHHFRASPLPLRMGFGVMNFLTPLLLVVSLIWIFCLDSGWSAGLVRKE